MNQETKTEGEHRYVAVEIASECLFQLLTQRFISDFDSSLECIEGLPPGAKFVRSFQDPWRYPRTVVFVFEHDSFEIVPDGQMIPYKTIVFRHASKKEATGLRAKDEKAPAG